MGTPSTFGGPMISKKNNKVVGMTIIGSPDQPAIFQPITPLLDWIWKPRNVTFELKALAPEEAKFLADVQVPGKLATVFKATKQTDLVTCNAFILSPTEIVTNAHCVHGAPYAFVKVNKLVKDAKTIEVTRDQISIHKDYQVGKHEFDIAKIRLKEPLQFNDNVGSIDVADKDYKLNDPSEVVSVYGDMLVDGSIQTRRYDTNYLDDRSCKPKNSQLFFDNHLFGTNNLCYISGANPEPLTISGGVEL
ncbi:coagulation factor X-like [Sitodiplosis mosellana]|uniref:coagulation factor X-like n=1 Tax=Sitodiplosis mosellana TaxID=263140 RepID=UPI0024438201|nr:coagulation factor X-like [Sitodiplosis mosellana]